MTGGVMIWEGLYDFEPGYRFEKDKNLKRKIKTFKTNDMLPKKGHALVFDSRLLHQSLGHFQESERKALSFRGAANNLPMIKVGTIYGVM